MNKYLTAADRVQTPHRSVRLGSGMSRRQRRRAGDKPCVAENKAYRKDCPLGGVQADGN